ncbi:MAG: hypothetical protein NTX50_15075 [Candidatus Sumerlaeota bacterium]|nr:hypothetical protein [Candidatus Sumerlaeota bacterium]
MPPSIKHLNLIHGLDVEAINKSRDQLLDQLIPREFRFENMTEHISTSNQPLRLEGIALDIMNELSMLSLFADSRRVVVVTDLRDLCESGERRSAGRGKASTKGRSAGKEQGANSKPKISVTERFCGFLTGPLLQTPNAIVFLNYEKGMDTAVSKDSPIYKAIQKAGVILDCRGENKTWALEDALRGRDASKAIRLFRDAHKGDTAIMLFNTLLRVTRSLLQAKVVETKRRSGVNPETLKDLFPPDKSSYFKQHSFVQQKNSAAAARFNTRELTEALRELLEINRLVIPVSTDVYVRDLALAVELWILKWFSIKR